MLQYRTFFGFEKEPFIADIKLQDILLTDALSGVKERFDYALRLGGIALVTGEIGSGKSTALRYATCSLHPSEHKVFNVTACSGSILELYRQIAAAMGLVQSSASKAKMSMMIQKEIVEVVLDKKLKVVLVVDEASLLRLEVFAELHTLSQFKQDSKHFLPIILAGQNTLVDKLSYRPSAPLASRVITRTHLDGLDLKGMRQYIIHHQNIAGVTHNLFEDSAITAIHQASGGLLRKSNHLSRGALIAAAKKKASVVTAEHVRIASTEIF